MKSDGLATAGNMTEFRFFKVRFQSLVPASNSCTITVPVMMAQRRVLPEDFKRRNLWRVKILVIIAGL